MGIKLGMRNKTSLLKALPEEIFQRLDKKELASPNGHLYFFLSLLEKCTQNYVVVYKRDAFEKGKNIRTRCRLCGNIKGARLNKFQILCLKFCEQLVKNRNASFAVYKKPLELISPPRFPDVQ